MNTAATRTSTTTATAVPSTAPAVERAGALPAPAARSAAAKDRTLTSPAVVEAARTALACLTEPEAVGEHVGASLDAERTVTHLFDCMLTGYRGWRWAVTVARPPRGRSATICEMELLPGEDALLAPAWVPWVDRLQPGDVSRSDRLPRRETDERLEPGWEATGDEEGDTVALDELDLGRARVLSAEGVTRAAQRWYDGDHGPQADGVRKAHATCSTCGFFIHMSGPLRRVFGICANEWAADDGRVVSLDHGCGAHSETDLPDQGPEWPIVPSRLDEEAMEPLGTDGASIRGSSPAPTQDTEDESAVPPAERRADVEPAEGGDAETDTEGASPAGIGSAPDPVEEPGEDSGVGGPAAEALADSAEGADGADGAGTAADWPLTEANAARHVPAADRGAEVGSAVADEASDASVLEADPAPAPSQSAPSESASATSGSSEPGSAGSPKDRAAAARDAVADLAAELGPHQPARPASDGLTLAELEAHLPDRR
ncbi:MAG: DUF3027 domain-containing protein [Actinomyces sp.]|uniref:DUF3027 domain-containing protein n=1 Tax=Actinomyces sp. TaxID=29317 RepID=UPI0026DCDADE|nr:DUF3027 domain-containing protein [Actinomyces sp.]MDO4244200.1 DUF3027 domain-containing protein [Actinomyces sp.]